MALISTLAMNPTIDKSTSIERVVSEQKLRCETPRYDPGGGGVNVARAIRKLGGEALAFFTAGQASGQMLQELLEQEKIQTHAILIENQTRESFTVHESATGRGFLDQTQSARV